MRCAAIAQNLYIGAVQRNHALYQVHWPERKSNFFGRLGYEYSEEMGVSIEETLEAMSALVKSGKDRYIGISNETPWGTNKYIQLAKDKGFEKIVSIQNPYSLLNRIYEVGLAEISHHEQVGLLAYSPLGFGQLTGKYIDKTEENLQSRCRGVTLMSLSNKLGYLVLTTGNKSEAAVGYSTLYGDTAGGFSVLKDVSKTLVYKLSNFRNSKNLVIPKRIIERPPSAELAPNQKDTDSLPDYSILDPIIEMYVEKDMSPEEIISEGFDGDEVRRILRLIDLNEYKRRQVPIGIKISDRNFGKDRRYPITNGWRP